MHGIKILSKEEVTLKEKFPKTELIQSCHF